MTQRERESVGAGRTWTVAALVLVILLLSLLYVLSIGPVVALAERTGVGEELWETFYAPVVWLHGHTPLRKPLDAYAKWWGW